MALRKRDPQREIRVWARSDAGLDAARCAGIGHGYSRSVEETVRGAGTVVFCTPVESMAALAAEALPHVAHDAVVTDAGSAKVRVADELGPLFGARLVPAHPIAGSEKTGVGAASPDLFEGATCVVTPTPESAPDALRATREFWEATGCRVVEMTPEAHDAALARTSHLPHVVAAALVECVRRAVPDWPDLVGGGFRDSTRIAGGSAELWAGILQANREEVACSVAEVVEILQNVGVLLEAGDERAVAALLESARSARSQLAPKPDGT